MQTILIKQLPDGSCRAAFVEEGEVQRTIEADDVSDIYAIMKEEDHPQTEDVIPLYDL